MAGLLVTPLRTWTGINLIKYRRALGVSLFLVVLAHLGVWVFLDLRSFSDIWIEIAKRPYITVDFWIAKGFDLTAILWILAILGLLATRIRLSRLVIAARVGG